MSIRKDLNIICEAAMNEGAGAAVTFHFNKNDRDYRIDVDFDCKDFADLHDKFTKEEINVFIKDTIKYVELRFKENRNADTEFGVYSNSLPF